MMYYSDDTTTTITLGDEDKTQLLNGIQRLQYFADERYPPPMQKSLQRQSGLLGRLTPWIKEW